MNQKVVVIGAGPAGLTAAYELIKRGYDVTVLEASDAIGGISRTVRYHGNRMDIGGHRFFSKDDEVTDWWHRIMPLQGAPSFDDKLLGRDVPLSPGGPDPEKEDVVMLTRNRVSRIYYNKKFFDYPIKMNASTLKSMGFAATMEAGFSYLYATVRKRPETSLENFYINRFGRKIYSMFFESYTEKLWGRHPSGIDASWGAQRVKGLSVIAVIKDMFKKLFSQSANDKNVETSLIEAFNYPKYGPGELWETVADQFVRMGGSLLTEHEVTGVDTVDGTVKSVTVATPYGNDTVYGDLFISSMPLKDLIAGMSGVPGDICAIAAGLPYRDFVTVGLLVRRLNLKNKTKLKTLANIIPDCWIYVQDTGVKLGRIQIFNNWSPYLVADPENTVWIGLEYFCNEGDSFWNMSEGETIDTAVCELIKMGILDSSADVLDSHREQVRKAYPAYFDTYEQIDELIAYLDTFDNLFCVGRNGQHRYNNMDHSMATSFEAVRNIESGRKDKSNIWSVNTEQSYHEAKAEKS